MNNEENAVVSSKKWGSYIENDTIGEKIMFERVGDTFEMTQKAKKNEGRHSEGVAMVRRWRKEVRGLGGRERRTWLLLLLLLLCVSLVGWQSTAAPHVESMSNNSTAEMQRT